MNKIKLTIAWGASKEQQSTLPITLYYRFYCSLSVKKLAIASKSLKLSKIELLTILFLKLLHKKNNRALTKVIVQMNDEHYQVKFAKEIEITDICDINYLQGIKFIKKTTIKNELQKKYSILFVKTHKNMLFLKFNYQAHDYLQSNLYELCKCYAKLIKQFLKKY